MWLLIGLIVGMLYLMIGEFLYGFIFYDEYAYCTWKDELWGVLLWPFYLVMLFILSIFKVFGKIRDLGIKIQKKVRDKSKK